MSEEPSPTKLALERLWQRDCFNPLHINIVADCALEDGRRPAGKVEKDIWIGKGRKVEIR